MANIHVLPPNLVNRIAAGECVERPASVVKELVENALDAGATRVDVAIVDGGRELIQVRDDGGGMDADDLRLSIHPHATSKIREDDDLFNIQTMGFRGEALASIGSIARLTISTRTGDSDAGHRVEVDAGVVGEIVPCAGPVGTTVEVRDLFYAVPARRKFMRTNATEMGHITEQFARIALANPGVAMTLRHQNRETQNLPATDDMRQRIADFYGADLADVLLPIRREGDGVVVEGLVAPPKESRASGKWEYVFVNGRYVRDRFVSHAIKAAYRSLIDPSRYPVTFLFITIQPRDVDVNVHPTKVEVRWRDSNYIHGQVLAALREKFLSTNLDHSFDVSRAEDDEHRERVRKAMVDFFTRKSGEAATQPRLLPDTGRHDPRWGEKRANDDDDGAAREAGDRPRTADDDPLLAGTDRRRPVDSSGEPWGLSSEDPAASRAPVVQVHNTYLVVETDEGVMIIDQHALHERILYEEFRARIAERPLESQRLLLPDIIAAPADRLEAIEAHADALQRMGIELTISGPQSVTLHAFPTLLERVDRPAFVLDLLDRLAERGQQPDTETIIHDLLDMMACKAAVKAGDPLTREEIDALLLRRQIAERSSHCPHGRPTTLHLSIAELEKQFKRR